jgi:ribosomal silencing factor RsfS
MLTLEDNLEGLGKQYVIGVARLGDFRERQEDLTQRLRVVAEGIKNLTKLTEIDVPAEQDRMVRDEITYAAKKLAKRNDDHVGPSTKNDPSHFADQRVISTYERNKDVAAIRDALQGEYDAAVRRQEKQKKAQENIGAGVVLMEYPDRAEVYVTVPFDRREEGLMGSLTEAVGEALLDQETVFEGPHEEEGVVWLTATAHYDGLFNALKEQEPEGFAAANVEYKVLFVRSLKTILSGKNNVDNVALEDNMVLEVDRKNGETDESDVSWQEKIAWTVVDGARYVPIRDSRAVTGIESTTLFSKLEEKGGPIKSIKHEGTRLLEVESLIAYVEHKQDQSIVMHSSREASELWQQRANDELGETGRNLTAYRSQLGARISDGKLKTINGTDGKSYVSGTELDNFFTGYFAGKHAEIHDGTTVPRVRVEEILHTHSDRITKWVGQGKLRISPDNNEITRSSVRSFVKAHNFRGGRWLPKTMARRK